MSHNHHDHDPKGFGFLVDTPEIRALIDETRRIVETIPANDTACIWRHKFDPASGTVTPFRSGYVNAPCPPDATP